MELTPKTKLGALLKDYPFLVDFLVHLNPRFAGLANPVLRNTFARAATLAKIAAMGGEDPEELIKKIAVRISQETGEVTAVDTAGVPLTKEARREVLKELISDLHGGADKALIKERFAELIEDIGATEVAELEQELITVAGQIVVIGIVRGIVG